MTEPNKGGGLGSIIMLLTLLVGGVALESQINLTGSRPSHENKRHSHPLSEQDVDARLWQDPFQAVDQFVESHQDEDGHEKENPQNRWLRFGASLKSKSGDLEKSEKILVLGVMVSSGGYFVNAEDRIRTRYAVISGLASSGYQPENSEFIGFLEGKELRHVHLGKKTHDQHHHLPDRLPYEWFVPIDENSENSKSPVLVLWLNNRHFFHVENKKIQPLKNIQILFQHLTTPIIWPRVSDHSHLKKKFTMKLGKREYEKFRFAVIGPTSSGELKEMVREVSARPDQESGRNLPDIKILSTRATKDEQQILQKVLPKSELLAIWKYLKMWKFLNRENIFKITPWKNERAFQKVFENSSNFPIRDLFNKEDIHPLQIPTVTTDFKLSHVLMEVTEQQKMTYERILEDSSNLSIRDYFNKKNVHFLRTTPTDLELAQALVRELKLRGINKNSPIGLISEWDTDYGRAFRETICKAWLEAFPLDERVPGARKSPCSNIYYFGYLRGLDGQIPEPTNKEKEENSKKDSIKDLVEPEDATSLRAERERQYDYLLRLAGQIKEIEKNLPPDEEAKLPMFQNPRFEAFGILGSDYYDKLVVLQALRKKFTHTHFFTTDMDARFFHSKDYKYVRNLIVASGFGLRLRDDLQNPIPPFRDTYQTSAFLATRLALEPEARIERLTQDQLDQWLQARVFEIGRTEAFDLSRNEIIQVRFPPKIFLQTQAVAFPTDIDDLVFPFLYPVLGLLSAFLGSFFFGSLRKSFKWAVPCIGVLIYLILFKASQLPEIQLNVLGDFSLDVSALGFVASLLASFLCYQSGKHNRYLGLGTLFLFLATFFGLSVGFLGTESSGPTLYPRQPDMIPSYKYSALGIVAVVLGGILCWRCKKYRYWVLSFFLILGYFTLLLVHLTARNTEEPLAFFQGVSLWPTDFFRLTGFLAMIFFVSYFRKKLIKNERFLRKTYRLNREENNKLEWLHLTSSKLFWKVFLGVGGFILVGFLIMFTFGFPFTPVRGETSFIVNKINLGLFILAFGVSIFYAGVYLNETIQLVRKFQDFKLHPGWTDRTVKKVFPILDISDFTKGTVSGQSESSRMILSDLISMRFIGKRTDVADELIYFPFLIMAVGLLGRARVFDNWDFPLPLISLFGFGAGYLLYKAWCIQNEAKKRKTEIIDDLITHRINFQAKNDSRMEKVTKLLIRDTRDFREGAFRPFVEHPFFKALLLPFSGFGGMALLEYMFLAV